MKTFLHGFVLILFALSSASVRGAVAANEVILTQRNSGNTTNVQSPVTATANAVIMYNDTLVPVSKTIVAGDNITVTQNAGNITINSTGGGGGSGNVTTTGATANVVMVGGGTTAIVPLASLGTAGHPLVSAGAGAPPAFGVVSLAGGGTGISSTTKGNIILGNNSTTYGQLGVGADNYVLTANSSATYGVSWEVAGSGSGNVIALSSLTANYVPKGNGTVGLSDSIIQSNATTVTIGSAGAGNIIANVVTLQNLTVTDLNATNLTLTNQVPVAAGGTNLTTITANNIITGNGTGTPILIAPGTAGNILGSNGTAWASTTPALSFSGALGTDDTYSGLAVSGLLAGATIAQWEAVYLDGSSTWQLADANGSGTYPAIGLAVAAYSSTNPAVVVYSGTVRNDAWSWTPGGVIYLSATAGGLTQTAPSTSGDKVQQIGRALTADIILLNVNSEYLTVQ